jgi:medium-chain acyl-[acyl-carrier-protein] hydrolase
MYDSPGAGNPRRTPNRGSWFSTPWPRPKAKVCLLCFPYAGGGASTFRSWPGAFAETEICIAQFPGHGARFGEPLCNRWPELTSRLAEAWESEPEVPYAIFGHSLGALIAFEWTRELRRRGHRLPRHLFLSAYRAPQLLRRHSGIHHLPDREFLEAVNLRHKQTAGEIFDDEFLAVTVPRLRAAYRLHETYLYLGEPALPCDISAFGGIDDEFVTPEELNAWQIHTVARFRAELVPGDHFFVDANPGPLLARIREQLEPRTVAPSSFVRLDEATRA